MEKTLVVMAAGMGSRFGGLKQIEPVGPSGEFIIDYSVYDAKKAGFEKVVFVIKKEHEDTFKETIGKRIEDKIKVAYTFQRIEDVPKGKEHLIVGREKPWGTGHAVLCAEDEVNDGFLVINADDFYGYEAFKLASDFLDSSNDERENASITYPFCMTASKFGSVKRGVCFPKTGEIEKVVESKVTVEGEHALCEPLNGDESFQIELDQPVAVNMFVFKHEFFKYLRDYYIEFFNNNDDYVRNNETLLTDLIKEKLEKKEISLVNIVSPSKWLGMTYKEDLVELKESIQKLIDEGAYPERLWD
ncbi:MAG: sugar phosphate nucleotidyltransferase [Ruminococcus sp.]|nr:sugar phosphate nucleotidyltransferase [Ruminococcus sp.]